MEGKTVEEETKPGPIISPEVIKKQKEVTYAPLFKGTKKPRNWNFDEDDYDDTDIEEDEREVNDSQKIQGLRNYSCSKFASRVGGIALNQFVNTGPDG